MTGKIRFVAWKHQRQKIKVNQQLVRNLKPDLAQATKPSSGKSPMTASGKRAKTGRKNFVAVKPPAHSPPDVRRRRNCSPWGVSLSQGDTSDGYRIRQPDRPAFALIPSKSPPVPPQDETG
ncbi:hypothetical protein [Acidiphilium sp.]|uniref:hypothetical protein n=1 Tax=Acidiphilium sp. TaxID=527 RepID=UPI00258BA35E|nr:hypothetical protein [Acidiphilium sp.]